MNRYLVLISVFLAVAACKTQSTIAHRAHNSRNGALSTIIRDTVMQHDSIYVHEFMQGDTVYVTKYRDRWRDKVVNRTDTVYVQIGGETKPVKPAKPAKLVFYKNCTWGFFILILLFLVRIAFRIMRAIYLRK